jgi:hypothetical protein
MGYWSCLYDAGYYTYLIDWIEGELGPDDIWDIVNAAVDCSESGGGISNPDDLPSAIPEITFVSLKNFGAGGDSSIFHYTVNELIDPAGSIIQPSIDNISLGLYELSFMRKDQGGVNYITFELKEEIDGTIPREDFVTANIYPVPHTNNYEFNINLQATANSRFSYEIFTTYGDLVHRQSFSIPQGHDEDHKIQLQDPLPKGTLINKFTFSDGSSFSITTINQ